MTDKDWKIEALVIGALLLKPDPMLIEWFCEQDFYDPFTRQAFRVIRNLSRAHKAIDLITVWQGSRLDMKMLTTWVDSIQGQDALGVLLAGRNLMHTRKSP